MAKNKKNKALFRDQIKFYYNERYKGEPKINDYAFPTIYGKIDLKKSDIYGLESNYGSNINNFGNKNELVAKFKFRKNRDGD